MSALQDEFEAKFPMPAHCVRCGESGYVATSFNAWYANEYRVKFEGYKAGHEAARATRADHSKPKATPTLWEAFEMGFSFRSALLGHVLDGRDVGRLTTCHFWHESMLGMHVGTDLHVGLSVTEATVAVKKEVKRRLEAFETASTLPSWFDAFLVNVCELSDRNSPENEPNAIVATPEELRSCALNAIEQANS